MYGKSQIIEMVRDAARRYGINEGIALRQIERESKFNPYAQSSAGAKGVAQFMPATARRFGLSNPFDPRASLEAWGKYMSWLLKRYNGSYGLALAAYNSGEGNVDKHHGVPPFTETRNYVSGILGRIENGAAATIAYTNQHAGATVGVGGLAVAVLLIVLLK
jgi:soluble lytic murein transglycosylase-like protein